MKISDLIKRLQTVVDTSGDEHIRYFKLIRKNYTIQMTMDSPTRKDEDGNKKPISHREFVEFCKNNPIENKGE